MSGKKIIFVVTNHSQLGDTGKETGWYLPEVAHPYKVLTDAGYQITFVSPKGLKAPMDPGSKEQFKDDPICKDFLAKHLSLLDTTNRPDQVTASEYKGLFYAGGHGPMFDLADNDKVSDLARTIYEQGGLLAAVCHGTVGFVPITLSSGEPLVRNKTVTSFTNSEEAAIELTTVMPFLLETKLKELGANFVAGADWACNVQIDGRIVTGQNPSSATKVGEEMVKLLSN